MSSRARRDHLRHATQLSVEKRARDRADKENIDPSVRATRAHTRLKTDNQSLKDENSQLKNALRDMKQAADNARRKSDSHRRSKNRVQQELASTRAALAEAVNPAREQALHSLAATNSILSQQTESLRQACEAQRRQIKCFRVSESRFNAKLDREVRKAVKEATTIDLKVKGKVPHRYRALVRNLSCLGVSVKKIYNVVRMCAQAFGLTLNGRFSHGLVCLCIKEGGVAADMQIADAVLHDATGITYSSDGTSDRGQHFQAHLINVQQHDGTARTYTLGVKRQHTHTAEQNCADWLSRTGSIWTSWNLSKRGCTEQMVASYFLSKLCGGQGDHNSGEKKLFRLMEAAHTKAVMTRLGHEVLAVMPDFEHLPLVSKAIDEMVASLGGSSVWASLSEERRNELQEQCLESVAHDLGVKHFANLPPEKQASLRFFVWAGCAMHKDLNSVVGGEQGMRAFWESSQLAGPIKLHNKDNAAAAASGDPRAKERADNVSQAGGAKLVSLLGNLVRNKDPKKGYQRNFTTYFRAKLNRSVQFPPVHQARFQSTGAAAGFTLLHLNLLTTFLALMRDKKTKCLEFNHLEENIYNALHDPPTLSEAAVHAIYHLATSQPYVRSARAAGKHAQDLGPLHCRVKEHCRKIIADPDVFTRTPPDRSHIIATLDGKPYAALDVMEAILALFAAGRLPHLRELIVAFYTGALEKWEPFTSEYADDSPFLTASKDDLARAPLKATNDDAESEFSRWRRGRERGRNMTVDTFNCKDMYRMNETDEYVEKLPEDQKDDLLPLGRMRECEQRKHRDDYAEVELWERQQVENVERERIRQEEQQEADRQLNAWLDDFSQRRKTRPADITTAMKNPELDEELRYHKHRGVESTHPDAITHAPSWYKKKEDKIAALKKALRAENSLRNDPMHIDEPNRDDMDVEFF